MNTRINELAELLVGYSCDLKKGEKILVDCKGNTPKPLIKAIIKEVYKKGGLPFVDIYDEQIDRELLLNCTQEQLEFKNECELRKMEGMDAYIGVRAADNTSELSDISSENLNMYSKIMLPTLEQRVNKTKWVILRYPNTSMAQLANMSTESFEDFFYNVCTIDYKKMSKAMDPLVELFNKTDKVRITAKDTDLTFSIKGIGAVKCDGRNNIPDGEVFSAPVLKSMNGYITYNTPSEEQGFTYENIRFEIKDGKIVKATANDTARINELLDTDDGARYFGEFAIGVNPYILQPMKDTLFDEKIAGSFHLTPGMAYEETNNGNVSAVHWDLVLIQRPEYGGGEIYFDDVIIRKNGLFVLPELLGLNPENLK